MTEEDGSMLTDDRMTAFINALDRGHSPFLEELYAEARRSRVPVIRREMQSFLRTLVSIRKPERILEVGTAVGFSAILMASANPVPCTVTTIENYEKRIREAASNFRRSGFSDQITLLEGDAADRLRELTDPFDFIFLDAAKGQYIRFLPELLRLMRPGSILLADNVLQGGDILESRFIVERRNRTIHSRMREFLRSLKDNPALETSILPLGDGAVLSVMREKPAGMEGQVS